MKEEKPRRPKKRRSKRRSKKRGAVLVVERNQVAQIVFRKLAALTVMAILAACISLASMVGTIGKPVPPVYVAVSKDGTFLPAVPLSEPNMGFGRIGKFALDAINAIYTYDYINWKYQLSKTSSLFTPTGWAAFQKQLSESKTIDAVKERKIIVSVDIVGAVSIKTGITNGLYTWLVKVPVNIVYTSTLSNKKDTGSTQKGALTLKIVRIPRSVSYAGVAIDAIRLNIADK